MADSTDKQTDTVTLTVPEELGQALMRFVQLYGANSVLRRNLSILAQRDLNEQAYDIEFRILSDWLDFERYGIWQKSCVKEKWIPHILSDE